MKNKIMMREVNTIEDVHQILGNIEVFNRKDLLLYLSEAQNAGDFQMVKCIKLVLNLPKA